MPRWLEIAVEITAPAGDALSNWLVERGAPGVIEEPLGGERVRIRAHFESEDGAAEIKERIIADARGFLGELESFFPGAAAAPLAAQTIDAQDWAEGWKQGFPPLEIGRLLCVRPPWSPPGEPSRHDIVIEPAMAFGTGHHASTLGCLLAIEEIFAREPALAPVLDVGTGSAILAIAAARLGAARVLAIDTDPVAVEAAAANVERNALGSTLELRCGSLDGVVGRFRLITANLYSGLLRGLFAGFAARAVPGAWLVAAGFLDADEDAVAAAAAANGWRTEGTRSLDGWTTLMFRRED